MSNQQALMGAWQQIVGAWQSIVGQMPQGQSGPGAMGHGAYGDPNGARGGQGRQHFGHPGFHGQGYGYQGGDPYQGNLAGAGYIQPRAALVEQRQPNMANREVLPMSTGVAILPTFSAQITARPQRVAFRPERVFISGGGTSGGAGDWIVNDIKIGNRSQFSQSGDVPGDMFGPQAIDSFVTFETAQTAMDVVLIVTYNGSSEAGVPFYGAIVGTAAV